ncbi:MAG: VWA domain-containing protein, partial [Clostridia bacterium]|nr:VWA domain-containing protein [Clostridia bacterium]
RSIVICYYNQVAEEQVSDALYVIDLINKMDNFDDVKEYVENSDEIENYNIDEVNESITYVTNIGITGFWSIEKEGFQAAGVNSVPVEEGPNYSIANEKLSQLPELPSNRENDIVVVQPFKSSGLPDTFEKAGEILSTAFGSEMTVYNDDDADLDVFKNLDDYETVLVYAHGGWIYSFENSSFTTYIATGVERPDVTEVSEFWKDFSAGRVVFAGDRICIGSGFIDKYYDVTFEDSFVFLGSCHGLQSEDFSDSLINKGVSTVVGYSNTVSIDYCNNTFFETVINSMLLSQNKISEAVDSAKAVYGEHDTYAEEKRNVICELKIDGDPNYSFYKAAQAAGEDSEVSITVPEELVVTVGELSVIEPEITPANISEYIINWTSSDTSVATVSPTGSVGLVTANAKGTAAITVEFICDGKTITKQINLRVSSKARDTILVLDISGSMYGTPLNEMKESAIQFCNDLLKDEYNNRVGIVFYDDSVTGIDLTNDLDMLIERLNGIYDGGMTNMESALSAADEMMLTQGRSDAIKNVIIMADGLPNYGKTSNSGSMPDTGYYGYDTDTMYANAVIDTAQDMMTRYNLYSLGFFHDLYGNSKDFAATLMQELTNKTDGYYQVDEAENLQFAFGDISDDISQGSKIVINIACPVDVVVTYGGEKLSSISTDFRDSASFGTLQLLGENQDIKVVSLDSDKEYKVELVGTGTGTMDYSVSYFDENEKLSDYRNFANVPITNKTKISSATDNSKAITLDIDEDGDGSVDTVWTAEQRGEGKITYTKNPVQITEEEDSSDNTVLIVVLVVIFACICIGAIIIVIICVHNKKEKTNEYDDELVIPYTPPVVALKKEPSETEVIHIAPTKEITKDVIAHGVIRVLSGPLKDAVIPIKDNETLYLGKDSKVANVVFSREYTKVSRLHCTVTYNHSQNRYFITDCSKNGTYLFGTQRLEKGKRTAVVEGTRITLANDECEIVIG